MSQQLINEYRAELDRLRAVSGSRRESVLREAFKDLLKRWGKTHDLQFIAEHDIVTKAMNRIYLDGALLHGLRVPFGYWEAKDESDDLEKEIDAKFRKGYPRDNIIFTDDATAVLWQDGAEVMRAAMQADDDSLLKLLTRFFAHERQEIADFNKAVKQFATDLPAILTALRDRIADKRKTSQPFVAAEAAFLQHARDAINPVVSEEDAVLHDPVYRETYALNLKREFPRIPFYPDFTQWVEWGEALMAMHIGYEEVEPWPIQRTDTPTPKRAEGTHPKPTLKSLPETGVVRVDEDTQIGGIPTEAWQYRLGNRSAIDWVLDQHKTKTPRDPTIREKFNTYRFADYKESMIDLLTKVVRVSVDTVAITEAMRALDRSGWSEA